MTAWQQNKPLGEPLGKSIWGEKQRAEDRTHSWWGRHRRKSLQCRPTGGGRATRVLTSSISGYQGVKWGVWKPAARWGTEWGLGDLCQNRSRGAVGAERELQQRALQGPSLLPCSLWPCACSLLRRSQRKGKLKSMKPWDSVPFPAHWILVLFFFWKNLFKKMLQPICK